MLEVKDWRLDTIRDLDKVSARILTQNGLKTVSNPLEQARQCAYQLVNHLQGDPQLVNQSGPHEGQLVFPYGYGVVLSNITRKQFQAAEMCHVFPEHQVICKDEMVEGVDIEGFQKRLWDMFNYHFQTALTLPQIDRIRWHLFPEIRINAGDQNDLFPIDEVADNDGAPTLLPDIMKVMDMQQELLARSLGKGHRVIHGVAGSGKTLILGYRCLYLAKLLKKPILVLCFNITLAARLRELVIRHGIIDKVNVYHFHDWCGEQLRTYNIDKPSRTDAYFDTLVECTIAAAEKGDIPRAQYGAVMIDEGHDFKSEWLKLVVSMVDPESDSVLLLYDDAQSIYKKSPDLDFSLSSVGIKARGRTTVLRLNYRNTQEVLSFAYRFASHYISPGYVDEDHVPLVEPESAGRHGPEPAVRIFDTYKSESEYIAHLFQRLHDTQNIAWSDMCVTYRSSWMGEHLHKALQSSGIPCQWLCDAKAKKKFSPGDDSVKLMTMHSSKGLEFPVVAVSGIGSMPVDEDDKISDAKLLYVAMTRSTEKLLLTGHHESEFVDLLRASMGADPHP